MAVVVYLDTILVPISLFLTVGYHGFLWRSFKNKPSHTTIGINMLKRRAWFQEIKGGDEDKMGMLAIQSLRNILMETTLTASITILIVVSLAALVNNAYSATHIFSSAIFGSQSTRIFALKYGSAALALSISFLCSSMAMAFLIDANFLINATGDHEFTSSEHTRSIFEKGFVLALVSSRMLCITFPVLLWMLGPILTASITILIVVSLAALVNNAYSATHIFSSAIFGSQSTRIFALKYGSAALALSISFLCSSMAMAFLIDANFLINATGDHEFTSSEHTRSIFEKGFVLTLVSSRMLCITFPVLLWMLGPIPVCLSSMALVWGLYGLDFAGKLPNSNKQSLSCKQ
ncbi:hypothetical protein ACLB2K_065175 [Fragaria x ananassa]